jgi:hypothetical protein
MRLDGVGYHTELSPEQQELFEIIQDELEKRFILKQIFERTVEPLPQTSLDHRAYP